MEIKQKKTKRHYYILLDGNKVGESWAVSAEKAINNFWWRWVKEEDPYSTREYDPEDFDAVEV